jgi:hypothetical protein
MLKGKVPDITYLVPSNEVNEFVNLSCSILIKHRSFGYDVTLWISINTLWDDSWNYIPRFQYVLSYFLMEEYLVVYK